MKSCECNCGTPVKRRYVPGHQFRKKVALLVSPPVVLPEVPVNSSFQGPPPHPLPYDHGKYRIAEEPLGTDPFLPWEEFRCLECHEAGWRKNPKADLCEACSYQLFVEISEKRVVQENRTRTPYDPFA